DQEDLVIHRQPEQDGEHHHRHEGLDRPALTDAHQMRAVSLLEHRDHCVEGSVEHRVISSLSVRDATFTTHPIVRDKALRCRDRIYRCSRMAAQITAAITHSTTIDGQGDGAPGPSGNCRRLALPTTICATTRPTIGCGVPGAHSQLVVPNLNFREATRPI